MFNGVSSRTMSEHIHTTHYHGSASKFVVENDYTRASSALIKSPSFGFTKSSAPMPKAIDYSIDLTKSGHWIIYASANKKTAFPEEDFRKYGFTHSDDESMGRMDGWIGATTGHHAIEYVKPNGEIGLFELSEHIPSYSKYSAMTDVNVPIKHLVGTVPINKFGFYVSKLANAWEHSRDLSYIDYPKRPGINPETLALLETLISEGGDPREIDGIGVENLENHAAKIYLRDETATLVESIYIHQEAQAIAQKQGLDGKEAIDEIIKYFLKHELVHNSDRRKFISIENEEEIDVGEFLAKFFGERAEIVDEKLAKIYRALARENEDYAQGWKEGRIKSKGSLKSKLEYLAKQYASEARDMGLEGEEARDYVGRKLEEVKDSEESGLEKAVEKGAEAGENEAKDTEHKEYSKKETVSEDAREQEDSGEDTTDKASAEEAAADSE